MIPPALFLNPLRKTKEGHRGYAVEMRNRWILLGYLVLFFALVSFYDAYKDNVYIVALVALILCFAGLAAWVWSVQPGKED